MSNNSDSIKWSQYTTTNSESAALNSQKTALNNFANNIEELGYVRPEIDVTPLGQFTGKFEELVKIPLAKKSTAQTLEELEKRPIVINTTDKTDET